MEVFGTRGLSQSTMRDLCAEARLTDRYFYESFRRVEDVFEAVYAELTARLVDKLSAAMFQAPLQMAAVADAGLRAFFSFVREDPRRARIMLIDAQALRFSKPRNVEIAVDGYISLLSALYRALYPAAADLDVDVEFLANNLLGMTTQSAAAWSRAGFDKSLDSMVEHNLFAWRGLDAWVNEMIATPRV